MKLGRTSTPLFFILAAAVFAAPTRADIIYKEPANAEKVFRVCDDVAEPASLNPFEVFSEKTHTILQQSLEGLVRFDAEGKLEPALAERWERISTTTVRFHLRQGVSFHNGEPFNSAAVKFSVEKFVAPETKYPGYGFVATIKEVQVVDDYTVDVVTHIPDGILLNRLAAWVHMVPPKYYQSVGPVVFSTAPVGTGPFKFEKWESKKAITLLKNTDYWMKGYPKLDRLVFRFIPQIEDQIKAVIDGNIDLMTELPGTRTLDIAVNPMTKVVKKYTLLTMVGPFNVTSGPLKDIRVRKAINYALNRKDFIDYDLLGNGRTIATITMEGEEGHNPNLVAYPYDPDKARALLAEAGYWVPRDGKGSTKRLVLKTIVKEQGRRTIGVVKAHLARVGIELDIHYTSDANIIKDIHSGRWDFLFGGCSDPMVHSFFIQSIIFYSKSPFAIANNPAYDKMLEQMMTTLDDKRRDAIGQNLDKYIYENVMSAFTYQRLRTFAVSRRFDFVPYASGMPYFFLTTPSTTPIRLPDPGERKRSASPFEY